MIESLRDCPEYEGVLRNFRGQVFDSGPGRVSLAAYVRAMAGVGPDDGGSEVGGSPISFPAQVAFDELWRLA